MVWSTQGSRPASETLRLFASRVAARGAHVLGRRVDAHDLARLVVPDTVAARHADDLARRACGRTLLNHCVRTYIWAALIGIGEQRPFDAEALYVAALLHDIGLVPKYDTGRCFETDGAHVARELLHSVGWKPERAELVAGAIRDHWSGPESQDEVESVLLAQGAAIDVVGRRVPAFDEETIEHVVDVVPRAGFKREFLRLLQLQERKPRCHVRDALEAGFAGLVLAAPYDE